MPTYDSGTGNRPENVEELLEALNRVLKDHEKDIRQLKAKLKFVEKNRDFVDKQIKARDAMIWS